MKLLKSRLYQITTIILLLFLVVTVTMFVSGANDYSEQEGIIIDIVNQYKTRIEENGSKVVVSVNDKDIYLGELLRLEANDRINNEIKLLQAEKALLKGDIDQNYYITFVERLNNVSNLKSQNDILEMLIRQELLYQESLRQEFGVTFDEAYQYELLLDKEMRSSQKEGYLSYFNYVETLAKSYGMTYDEYIRVYIVPVRQKTLAIDKLIDSKFEEKAITLDRLEFISEYVNNLYITLYNEARIVEFTKIGD